MRRSEDRILTTHTGSLPRPPELTRLYIRRARGESIDPAELERLGRGGSCASRQKLKSISATTATSSARGFFCISAIG